MRFTPNILAKLEDARLFQDKLIVKGKNGFGQAFRIVGIIMDKLEDGSASITENSISVSVGKIDEQQFYNENLYITLYTSDFVEEDKLYIESIIFESNGERVFHNEDFEENLYPVVKKAEEKYDIKNLPSVVKKYILNLGKPVAYKGKAAVITSVSKKGTTIYMGFQYRAKRVFAPIVSPIRLLAVAPLVLATNHTKLF